MSWASAPRNFMPSLARLPPPTTTTFSCTSAAMSAPPSTSACTGAQQNAFTSAPPALGSPAISAIAFARLPPPRWYRSPTASSPQPSK